MGGGDIQFFSHPGNGVAAAGPQALKKLHGLFRSHALEHVIRRILSRSLAHDLGGQPRVVGRVHKRGQIKMPRRTDDDVLDVQAQLGKITDNQRFLTLWDDVVITRYDVSKFPILGIKD